jgi:hypothetical protein
MSADATAAWSLLDIGADVGALLVDTDPEWAHIEIEVQHLRTGQRTHAVATCCGRHVRALFPALGAGDYAFTNTALPRDPISIRGGEVTVMRLPAAQPPRM